MVYLDSFPKWLEAHSRVIGENYYFDELADAVDSRVVSSIVVG